MQNEPKDKDLVALIDQTDKISEMLGIEYDTPNFWGEYRRIRWAIKDNKIPGKKTSNKYLVDELALENYLNQRKNDIPAIRKTEQCKSETNITVDDIKKIITDLGSVGIEDNKILALIKRKLGIDS
jgi:hypothetical protein